MTARARLQAPRESGGVLADPPLTEVGRLLSANTERLEHGDTSILGRSLAELRLEARRETLAAAAEYLGAGGEPLPTAVGTAAPRLILAGHQPELFHPGVWVKNFALHGLAAQHGCAAVNLLVDTDLVKSIDLKVPAFTAGDTAPDASSPVQRTSVAMDRRHGDVPFEERRVVDEDMFASLAARVLPAIARWPFTPMLGEFWQDVAEASRRTPLLGERLASARRTWERRWGCHNWEVPVSRVCGTEAFAWFACHVLAEASRFHEVYNASVQDYRAANGIKDRIHPVPDLTASGEWLEVPFWGWRTEQSRRGRLMVRRLGDVLGLRIDNEDLPSITLTPGNPSSPAAAWRALEKHGWKLRSRALTTTLFARLFLGDLFVHGIGGAKYDEITDEIIRQFYGIEPPRFVVLSATLHLPFPVHPIRAEDHRQCRRQKRDLWWNPQRHMPTSVGNSENAIALVRAKQEWINRDPGAGPNRRERFLQLRSLTADLRPFVSPTLEELRERVDVERGQLQANAVFQRRDYSFCLYPEALLREFLGGFLRG